MQMLAKAASGRDHNASMRRAMISARQRSLSYVSRDLTAIARDLYRAFAAGDRRSVEHVLAEDFAFSSPLDVGLDRAGYFERCWPGAGRGQQFEFVRVVKSGDEVIVTYEMTRSDGG